MKSKWLIAYLLAASACGGFFFKNKKPVWIDPSGDTPLVITNNSKQPLCSVSIEFSDLKEPPGADPYTVSKPHYMSLSAVGSQQQKQLDPGASIKVGVKQHTYDVFIQSCDSLYSARLDKLTVSGPAAFGIDGPERTAPESYARTEFKLEFVPPSSTGSPEPSEGRDCMATGLETEKGPQDCCSGRGHRTVDPYVTNKIWTCD